MPDPESTSTDKNDKKEQPERPRQVPIQETKESKRSLVPIVAAIFAGFSALFTGVYTCIYRDATHMENRAYIVLKGFGVPDWMSVGDTVQATALLTNVGRTPAYDVSQFNALIVDTGETFSDYYRKVLDIGHTVGPNIECPIVTDRKLVMNPVRFEEIKSGRATLFFYISVVYKDVFGVLHRTAICVKYDPTTNSFVGARSHNYAD